MLKIVIGLFLIFFACNNFPANSQSVDCSLNEDSDICQEGECRLDTGEIGLCQQSDDGCVCVGKY